MWSDFDSLWTSLVLTYLFQAFLKGAYSWLPITQILANPNQSWFPLDFLHTGTVILPSITQTSCNSKKFLFPFRPFLHNFTLDESNNVLSEWQAKKQKQCTEVQNTEFISQQPCQFFAFSLSPKFKLSVHHCTLIKLCCLIPFSEYLRISLVAP